MGFIANLAEQAGQAIIGGGMGLLLEKHNDRRQIRQQQKLQDMQIQGSKQLTDYQYGKQLQMWKDTNYNAQMAELKKAGLNPGLMYGMGGGGGVTTGSGGGSVSSGNAPSGGGEIMGMVSQKMQLELLNAQKENIEADTKQKEVTAEKTGGVDTENVKADTENKVLAGVIAKYTGMEAKDQYERIKSPGRAIEAKTYTDEMEARQGIAGTIYDLWKEGKLHEKAINEIESIALGNAKSRVERIKIMKETDLIEKRTKGQGLDNMLKELEVELQKRTGIDRNSPGWLRVLGRWFADLTYSGE